MCYIDLFVICHYRADTDTHYMWAKVTTYLRYTAEERLVIDAASIFKLFGGA